MTLQVRLTLGEGGRIVIPAEFRQAMGIKVGDQLVIRIDDGELRAQSLKNSIKEAQALIKKHIPENVSLTDEFIKYRREEAGKE